MQTDTGFTISAQEQLEGIEYMKQLIRTLAMLITSGNGEFDAIVAAGNSGIGLADVSKRVYRYLKHSFPAQISIPIQRYNPTADYWEAVKHGDFYDNMQLLPMVKQQMTHFPKVKRVLFVDDELAGGTTLHNSLELITQAQHAAKSDFQVTAIGENKHFHHDPAAFDLTFYPLGARRDGYTHVIFCSLPTHLYQPLAGALEEHEVTSIFNVLMGLPTKEYRDGISQFTQSKAHKVKRALPNLAAFQKELSLYIDGWIEEALSQSLASPLPGLIFEES